MNKQQKLDLHIYKFKLYSKALILLASIMVFYYIADNLENLLNLPRNFGVIVLAPVELLLFVLNGLALLLSPIALAGLIIHGIVALIYKRDISHGSNLQPVSVSPTVTTSSGYNPVASSYSKSIAQEDLQPLGGSSSTELEIRKALAREKIKFMLLSIPVIPTTLFLMRMIVVHAYNYFAFGDMSFVFYIMLLPLILLLGGFYSVLFVWWLHVLFKMRLLYKQIRLVSKTA